MKTIVKIVVGLLAAVFFPILCSEPVPGREKEWLFLFICALVVLAIIGELANLELKHKDYGQDRTDGGADRIDNAASRRDDC